MCCICGGGNREIIPCACRCEREDDLACWEGCFECLDAIFGDEEEGEEQEGEDEVEEEESGDVEEEEQEDGDEAEGDESGDVEEEQEGEDEIVEEEETPEPEPLVGIDCGMCYGCNFPEMECWQGCFDCLFPYCENDDWECIGMAMEEES